MRKNISEKRKDGTLVVNEEAPVKKKRRWDVPTPAAGEGTYTLFIYLLLFLRYTLFIFYVLS